MTTPDDLARLRAETTEALRRLRTYLALLPDNAYALGEIVYGREFRSESWPRGCYAPQRSDLAAVLDEVARLTAERDQARALVRDMTDPGECWFDHHGYCREHGWFDTDPACPHGRAKKLGLTDTTEENEK